ncbi:hypothetical protein V6Z11_D07G154000 [Gossypium hirsutum]
MMISWFYFFDRNMKIAGVNSLIGELRNISSNEITLLDHCQELVSTIIIEISI